MATTTVPDSNGRARKDTKVAVEDSETWVEAKRYTVYKVSLHCKPGEK